MDICSICHSRSLTFPELPHAILTNDEDVGTRDAGCLVEVILIKIVSNPRTRGRTSHSEREFALAEMSFDHETALRTASR